MILIVSVPPQNTGETMLSRRLFHTSKVLLDELAAATTEPSRTLGKGKKKAPPKQSLIILDARKSNLYNRNGNKRRNAKPMMMLDDLELSTIREKTSKLLLDSENPPVTEDTVNEELSEIINAHRPTKSQISKQRYLQISNDISQSFTVNQIKKYIQNNHPKVPTPTRFTKRQLIASIIQRCWKCEISQEINPQDDLIQTKSFYLTKKEMFLLMSQSSIIQNWMRVNVKIVLFPTSSQLVISANEAHLQYIEWALASLFKQCKTGQLDLGKVEELFATIDEDLPLEDIQRLSGVFFEKTGEDGEHLYTMSSLGEKKFIQAKRLILWSLDYNPFMKVNVHVDDQSQSVRFFKTLNDQSLPWIHRKKTWYRMREPKKPLGIGISSLTQTSIDSAKIFKELSTSSPNTSLPQIKETQAVTAVAFGQILHSTNDLKEKKMDKTIMNTDVPFIHERVMKLPLAGSSLDSIDTTVDNHTYYAQIKFFPSPFNKSDNYSKFPPLEFWFDIDEKERAKKETLQVLCITSDQNSMISLPQCSTDLKFVKSEMVDLAESYASEDEWLMDQPGIKQFLTLARLNFNGHERINVPEYVDVKLPGIDEPVRYDYVTMCHRRQLDLEYKGRLMTFATLEGGSLGGSTSEVIMVGKEDELEEEGFQNLVNDALSFVKELQA